MEETGIGCDQSFIAHDDPPKKSQLGKRPLDDPVPLIARKLAPILMGSSPFVSPRHSMSCLLFLPGNSWRYDTPTSNFEMTSRHR